MQFATLSNGSRDVKDEEVAGLGSQLRGALVTPGEATYDARRAVFNGMHAARPAAIAVCRGAADVVAAVNFAREHELLFAVRSGGHSLPGHSTIDGGLVIDLTEMRGVRVDAAAKTVRVEGGATWADVDGETQLFCLAVPGGVVSTTGVAGLTLNGGLGYLRSKYGFSCDNLLSADIVIADGRLITASATANDDLYWALRGGGGNFGVVTSFEFKAHPVGPNVAAAITFYPIEQAETILAKWAEIAPQLPDEVATNAVLWTMPASPHLPPPVHGHDVVIVVGIHCGDADEGARVMLPLRSLGEPLFDMSGALPWVALQAAFDFFFPVTGEVSAYFKSLHLNDLTADAIARLKTSFAHRASKTTLINLPYLGRGVTSVPVEATAFAGRNGPFMVSFDAVWPTGDDPDANVAWSRESWNNLQPLSTGGVYLNFAGDEQPSRELIAGAFGPNYRRLVEIKRKYDPANMFRLNQNIRPD
jgi:FAD/FMN-containing dehydrogenase